MRISDLNKLIDIQAPTMVSNGAGGFTTTWVTLHSNIAAAIWPISATEQIQSMQMSGTITHRVRIRHRAIMKTSWRIKYGNRYFNIVGPPINPNEKNELLDIMCKEAA